MRGFTVPFCLPTNLGGKEKGKEKRSLNMIGRSTFPLEVQASTCINVKNSS